ncbi:AI-2E family transporter [Larsenimonas suaedae]|uniref:AI-2E family transporter n=1 Tax=Larsenimonas suaedae TaxID=1851019 RepID=A0ABU1GTU7_9GAMM|nr:AI-2E family transporter [Larsenimonas suaedae]MCM2971895.1 AI-2E family transporter [Larsenimonas suaedae]MDR5895447.1 AI-2E family transporter [Larsenimonas suaedae]
MAIKNLLKHWVDRYFSDEEAVILGLVLLVGLAIVVFFGQMLAPFLTALVIAFLLQGGVTRLERWGLPRLIAVLLIFLVFIALLMMAALVVLPLVWDQLTSLVGEVPRMFARGQQMLDTLRTQYPTVITPEQIQSWVNSAAHEATQFSQRALRFSFNSLGNVLGIIIYLVLVPILVFFMLKDQERLIGYFLSLLPRQRTLMTQVWKEMDGQIANFVRGKVIEIIIVGSVSYVTFVCFGLPYSALLGLMVGFSVLVPYIGAAAATLPIAAVAGFHFGLGDQFLYVMVAYAVIQALDGNVLVPILFSEAVNLHPVAIILGVLFFGGIWGFWGVFFAIPLTTLLKALLHAWPRSVATRRARKEALGEPSP